MVDLRKIKDEAAAAFTKGKWAKAVDLYEQVVKGDPKDTQAAMKLGDALVKNGNKPKAVLTYQKLAENYASQGFLPKAIAVCKVILEIDKTHNATQQILASLYAKKVGPDAHSGAAAMPAVKPMPPRAAVAPPAPAPVPAAPSSNPIAIAPRPVTAAPVPESADVSVDLDVSVNDAPLELDTGDHASGLGPATPVVAEVVPPPSPARPPTSPPRPPAAPVAPAAPPRPTLAVLDEPIDLGPELIRPPTRPPPAPPPPTVAPAAPVIPAEIDTPLELDIELSPEAELRANPPAPIRPDQEPPPQPIHDDALDAAAADASNPEVVDAAPVRPTSGWGTSPSAEISWGGDDDTSIETQLEQAAAQQAGAEGPTPLATPAEATGGEEDTEVEIAFDVPMAGDSEEEIEVLSVTAELQKNAGRELPKIPLFSDLAPEAFVELTEQCGFIRAEPGQKIISEGDAGNSFFVVCGGKMRVTKSSDGHDLLMAHLGEGAFFGEMALLSGARRAATVVAEEESELLEISAPVLNGMARRYPHVASSLRSFGRQRLLSNVMATSALFRPFDKPDRKRLVELFKVREVKQNELVVEEGQPTDGLYLVMSGALDVVKGPHHAVLATLVDGDIFGEMSLLSKKPASANVSATRRSTVLRLPRERFEELIVTYPQVLMLVSDLADSRTRANAQAMATQLAPDSASPLL